MRFTLKELATKTSSKFIGDENKEILGVNTLDQASENDISFLANPRYIEMMKNSFAGVICIDDITLKDPEKNYLVSKDPSRTFQEIAELFLSGSNQFSAFSNIHKTAVIHPSVKLGKNVVIGPNSVIDKGSEIGDNTFIAANVSISLNTKIGTSCTIFASVVVREKTIIKNRVILQPGCVIGSCGFGYTLDEEKKYQKLTQMGNVILEDDVEIGANTTIDRARFNSTIIKKGTKIDNLVQIAHNVKIGENTAIASQTGIAGSSTIGNRVIMGGQVGVTGHVKISDMAMLATRTGVSKNLKPGKYRGSPAIDLNDYNRRYVTIKNLSKTLKKLEDKISFLEEKLKNI